MSNKSLYETTASAAHKELLKEDLAMRISEAINYAGKLFEGHAFAIKTPVVQDDIDRDAEIERLSAKWASSKNATIKRSITADIKRLERERPTVQEYQRVIDVETFRSFLTFFYQVWLESKDQIGDKWVPPEAREKIVLMWQNAKDGVLQPRESLELFEAYLASLKACGVMNFVYNTGYTKGNQWRGSI